MTKLFLLCVIAFSMFGLALCDDNNANNTNFERGVSNLGNMNSNTNSTVNGNASNSSNAVNPGNAGNSSKPGGASNPGGDVKPGGDANTDDNLGMSR
jgi:hypothetical protein